MSEGSVSPKRPRLDFDDSAKDDHHDKYSKNRDQDDQGSYSNSRKRRGDTDDDDMKDCDEIKSKNVTIDAARREHTLVMRLTNKEQELQECMNQIQEMKQAQTQNTAQLRSMLLDPAINLVFQRMSKEMDEHKEKLKQKQNELNAWKFTPDSQTGMRLMGKCRMLLQENGDLGKMISSGRTARLEGEISLHKALVGEMKKNQKELDEFVGELEEDVEGMQGMIFMLQQQLKEAKEQIVRLQQENEQLRTLQLPTEPDPGGVVKNGLSAGEKSECLSPTSQLVKSSQTSTDHLEPNRSLLVPNTLIPLSNSVDSAQVSGSTDEFSSGSFSLKVTPDSGIQTQEEDDDTSAFAVDSPSVDEFPTLNSAEGSHNSQPDSNPHSTAKIPENHMEDGLRTSPNQSEKINENQDGILRTTGCDEEHEPSKPSVCERTSPTDDILTNSNGDIQVTTVAGSEYNSGDGEENEFGEEGKGYSKDGTGEEDEIDLKLTHSSTDNGDDIVKHLDEEQDNSKVNSSKLNLTNGSVEVEEVTSSFEVK